MLMLLLCKMLLIDSTISAGAVRSSRLNDIVTLSNSTPVFEM